MLEISVYRDSKKVWELSENKSQEVILNVASFTTAIAAYWTSKQGFIALYNLGYISKEVLEKILEFYF